MSSKPWLKYYDSGIAAALEYPSLQLDELLSDSARKYPDQIATHYGALLGSSLRDATLTYHQLNSLVDRFALNLQRLGVGHGERVAIMLPNCPQFLIAALAVWRIGAVVVCCNPLYVAREVHHLLHDSGAETIIVLSSLYSRVKEAAVDSAVQRTIVTNIKRFFPRSIQFLFTLTRERKEGHALNIRGEAQTYWFRDLLNGAEAPRKPESVSPDDLAVLVYTGGTTGTPKGVQLTHRNLVTTAVHLNIWVNAQEADEVLIAVMPFFHAYGLSVGMVASLFRSNTMVLIPDPRDLPLVLHSVEQHRATFYPGVPTMFAAFNNFEHRQKYDLTSMRMAASAAAPLPPEIQAQFEAITGGKMVEAYGLSEAVSAVTIDPVSRPRAHTIGVPLPDTNVKVVDVESGTEELAQGEIGELIVKGPQVMLGYWHQPEATSETIRQGPDGEPGWLFTGDTGYVDAEGYFHIADRKKDMIIAGGYNIYPANVEAVIYEHPKVREAAVVGVPDKNRGETVKAFVVLKEGQECSAEEIIAFCRERMAVYKAPRIVVFRHELPKSAVGKVLRRALREEDAGH